MKIGKIALSLSVAAIAVVLAWSTAVSPWRTNLRKTALDQTIRRLERTAPGSRAGELRELRLEIATMASGSPLDLELRMMMAACDRLLGRSDDALRSYQYALRIEQRPEIYLALATLQLERGEADAAVDSLIPAVIFQPSILDKISGEEFREAVKAGAASRTARNLSRRSAGSAHP